MCHFRDAVCDMLNLRLINTDTNIADATNADINAAANEVIRPGILSGMCFKTEIKEIYNIVFNELLKIVQKLANDPPVVTSSDLEIIEEIMVNDVKKCTKIFEIPGLIPNYTLVHALHFDNTCRNPNEPPCQGLCMCGDGCEEMDDSFYRANERGYKPCMMRAAIAKALGYREGFSGGSKVYYGRKMEPSYGDIYYEEGRTCCYVGPRAYYYVELHNGVNFVVYYASIDYDS